MKRFALMMVCLSLASRAYAAPRATPQAKAPQKEHTVGAPQKKRESKEPSAPAPAQQPSNRLEALHYFRDRPNVPGQPVDERTQATLHGLIAQREQAAADKRAQAIALLEAFITETPKEARELPEALLRLSELRWEGARADFLAAYAVWQKQSERTRGPEPKPDFTPSLALYERIITDYPDYARLDLVLYMRAMALLERGDEDAAVPLFQQLLAQFPQSRFAPDAHMALGEHVFNRDYDYRAALVEYDQVLRFPDSELYDLALFKSAWCLWQLDQKAEAATRFRKVLDIEGNTAEGSRRKHLKELQTEALEYLIQVFTEDERNRAADVRRFLQEIGGEQHVERVLRRLSATYFDQARFDRGIEAYQLLLEIASSDEQAPPYQLAIAKGYVAIDKFPQALDAYKKLASDFTPSGTWASQQSDTDTVDEAQAMIEAAVREQGLSFHELGQRDNRKEDFEHAVAIYQIYLAAFPKAPEAYRIQFYSGEILFHRLGRNGEAGEAYMAAAQLNPKGELTRDALYNAIGAFERVREGELEQCSDTAPCPETENDKRFSRAIELYAAYFPNDPDLPEILFRQGKLYYDRRIYDPAVRMFGALLERFPQSPFAADAGELVLDSFNRAADYENIEKWARKLKRAPAFKDQAAQKRLDGLILGAVFKTGEQLAEQGEHQRAADAYLRAADEFPQDARAPKALYNAGLSLSRAGNLERADKAWSELIAKYPGSTEGAQGAEQGAHMYESIAQFEDAARFYQAYAERFPRAEKAEAASYNAVLLLSAAGAHKDTVAAGKRYLAAYPKAPEAAEVTFSIARAQEDQPREAAATYRSFIERTHDTPRKIEAETRLGVLLLEAGDRKGADAAFDAAVADARKAKDKAKGGRYFAAQARFLQGDEALREFDAVKIEGNVAGLANRLKTKAKLLGQAAGIYAEVVDFGVAEWVTAALYKIGDSYERFAKALNDAPTPEGLSEQEQQVYRDELAGFVVPIEERALEAYAGGYKKAREIGIYNQWTTQMREALTRLNEVEYPKLNEIGVGLAPESEFPKPPVIAGVRRKEPAK
ncbi:MAG TPA: tetratricopeptide repeat protein [Polyangiales bacterium]|nr:tetratricopeptide repeat protein [Polyangiales bacterium]